MPKPEAVNWGILGPGRIAVRFAAGLHDAAGARLVAVGSRSAERAAQFAAEQRSAGIGEPRAHAGYEALAADPDVHAVYVATPHPQHAAACRLCLQAGKHVLCEKPLTVNAAEAGAVAACAREHGVLLMEGMWTRFIPATAALRALLAAGEVGEPHVVHADIGFARTPRSGQPPVRARTGRRRAARPGRVLRGVRVDAARHAARRRGQRPYRLHRRRRAHLGIVKLPPAARWPRSPARSPPDRRTWQAWCAATDT